MKIVAKTDQGKVRKDNQDSFAAGELPGGVVWAVVCDGMGGAAGGSVASQTAVKMISEKNSLRLPARNERQIDKKSSDLCCRECQFFNL